MPCPAWRFIDKGEHQVFHMHGKTKHSYVPSFDGGIGDHGAPAEEWQWIHACSTPTLKKMWLASLNLQFKSVCNSDLCTSILLPRKPKSVVLQNYCMTNGANVTWCRKKLLGNAMSCMTKGAPSGFRSARQNKTPLLLSFIWGWGGRMGIQA